MKKLTLILLLDLQVSLTTLESEVQLQIPLEIQTSLKDILARSDKTMWMNAMDSEIESLSIYEVWDLVELPNDRKSLAVSGYSRLEVLMAQSKCIRLVL